MITALYARCHRGEREMMSTTRKLLSALLALCMFAGGMPALGEGLETDGMVNVGILAEPVEDSREEQEIDLWTEEMDEAGPQERAVSAVGGGLDVLYWFQHDLRS